mgnify:CR=1 FL=1|jgi:hypothetical protein
MDKISIDVLFPSNDKHRFGEIDVRAVCDTYYNIENYDHILDSKVKTTDFDIQQLISKKEKRKQKLANLYLSIINNCLETVKKADMVDKTDMIYDIMNNELLNPNFQIDECVHQLTKKLNKLKLRTIRISNTKIFITWHHIVQFK